MKADGDFVKSFEDLVEAQRKYIDTLKYRIETLSKLVESYEKLTDALRKRVEYQAKYLIIASNWIRRRKAADRDGFIPDDLL